MAVVTRYINTSSTAGGDGTTNATAGANRAYATFAEWEAAEGTNLVTDTDTHIVYVTGLESATATLTINGFTTNSTYYVTIKAHSGQEANGQIDVTGFDCNAASRAVLNYVEDIRFEDISVQNHTTAASFVIQNVIGQAADIRIDRCHIFADGTGSQCMNWAGNYTGQLLFRNSVLNPDNVSAFDTSTSAVNDTFYFYNNTITGRLILRANTTAVTKNNIHTYTDAYLTYTGVSLTGTNNTHAEADQSDYTSSSGNLFSQTFTFTDAANDDYSLASGDTGAKDNGTDLSSDGTWPFSVDITNTSRSGTWDCGAFEYIAGGGGATGKSNPIAGPMSGPLAGLIGF